MIRIWATRRAAIAAALAVGRALGLAAASMSGCGGERTTSASAPDSLAQVAAVESTLVGFSRALATADSVQIAALTTPTFRLLDEGRTYDLPWLMSSIRPVIASGRMQRDPFEFVTEVRGPVAWSRYRVGGWFAAGQDTFPLALLETAVLTRDGSRWRLTLASTQPAESRRNP
jgi:hypothetical protein